MNAPELRIRSGTPGDAGAVVALIESGFATYRAFAPAGWKPPLPSAEDRLAVERILARDEVWYVVAEDALGHAGQCGFTPAHERRDMQGGRLPGLAHLWHLFVRRDLWGSGLAGELHDRATAAMRDRGYTRARLLTPIAHERARAFYARRGWREAPFSVEDAEDLAGLPVMEYRLDLG